MSVSKQVDTIPDSMTDVSLVDSTPNSEFRVYYNGDEDTYYLIEELKSSYMFHREYTTVDTMVKEEFNTIVDNLTVSDDVIEDIQDIYDTILKQYFTSSQSSVDANVELHNDHIAYVTLQSTDELVSIIEAKSTHELKDVDVQLIENTISNEVLVEYDFVNE